ncbi:hypothetical protein LAZ67_12000217 [Cordylochernes scorpioides]|uniref:RNA-directed DNA polymerase n=1 Tax=Cordylochernes scorpioides TaxID=51811 RepID=A0ABY6L0D0_9ARAC|nr:hypothetical protein LAZ67_12000217 [Cordylochernes scorpioides]
MLTTSNHPQANGLSERLNATLTGKLRLLHLQHPRASWTMLQSKVVKAYNDTPHSVTGFPPSYLMDGSLPKELSQHLDPYPSVTESRRLALQRTKERHKIDKIRFDKNHRSPDFEVGDLVLTKIYQHPNTGKLVPYFSGPYEIIEVISPYTVRINRPNQAQNLETEVIHVNKLKHYSEDTEYIFTPHSTNNNSKPKSYFIYHHFPPEIFHDDYKNYASTFSNPFNHMNPDIFLDNDEQTLTARYISTPDTTPKIDIQLEPSPTTKIVLPSSPTLNHTPQISPQLSALLINCDNAKLENRREEISNPYYITANLDNHDVHMLIDSGSEYSLLNKETWKLTQLKRSEILLNTWSSSQVKILGKLYVKARLSHGSRSLQILVADGLGPNILGRQWFSAFRLKLNFLNSLETNPISPDFEELFKEEIDAYNGPLIHIDIPDNAEPKFVKARTVPFALRNLVDEKLEALEEQGIIEPIKFSKWASPIVTVLKNDGTIRICHDYKTTVNLYTNPDKYPLPTIPQLLDRLRGGKVFTKLDMAQAYQQLKVDDESSEILTINTPRGLYRVKRLPFGLNSAVGTFQRFMDTLLMGIDGVAVYLDDVLISGINCGDLMKKTEKVLLRFKEAGLRLKRNKCKFYVPEIEFLGMKIDNKGIHPSEEKLRAIKDARPPSNKKELMSFLGLLNYYDRFLRNKATVVEPLHRLLDSNNPWKWNREHQRAFKEAKSLISSESVLAHFDDNLPILVSCDASEYGIGAILSQVDHEVERPVVFASRTLNKTERRYAVIDKEALAVIFGVSKFSQYLLGRKFKILTDHKPLVGIFNPKKPIPQVLSPRMLRWCLNLAAYTYSIEYKPGKVNCNADALSRLPLNECPSVVPNPSEVFFIESEHAAINSSEVAKLTNKDPILSMVKFWAMNGWPERKVDDKFRDFVSKSSEISVHKDCLLWGSRVIIPERLRKDILNLLHDTHIGIVGTKALARGLCWWPKMDGDIERMISSCSVCLSCSHDPPKTDVYPWIWPSRPWSRLHIDHAGPFQGKLFLVVVDAYSKWIEAKIVSTTSTETTINCLKEIFATHGLPDVIVSDNANHLATTLKKSPAKVRKCDLSKLAYELGEVVPPESRIVDLKRLILNSQSYEEEFAKQLLETLIEEREQTERAERERMEQTAQTEQAERIERERKEQMVMEFELEKLRIQTTRGNNDTPKEGLKVANLEVEGLETVPPDVYLKDVKIDNKETVKAMIDTGSSSCLMRESVARRISVDIEPDSTSLYGIGNQTAPAARTVGKTTVDLEIDGIVGREITVFIVNDDAQPYDLLIGRTWTDLPYVSFARIGKNLHIGYSSEFPFANLQEEIKSRRIELRATETVQLESDSINFTSAITDEVKDGYVLFTGVDDACVDSLLEVVDGKTTVPIISAGKGKLRVRKNQCVGRVELLNLDDIVVNLDVAEDSFQTKNEEKREGQDQMKRKRPILPEDINVNHSLTSKERQEILGVVNEYRDCFALGMEELGCTDVTKMDIKEVDGSKPVCLRPYKTTASEREAIREIVREWKDNGIVTETRSPYASPVLLVRKKTGDHRLVVDYRRLNIQTVKDKFPLPRIDDLLEGLRNAKFFTTLDLAHGYLQIPLTDKAKLKTAFITPDDTGQFERMIFGLANAPAEFQRLMHTVLGPLLNKKAFCYLDDVIIPAKDWREMIERLREVLERIRSAKLTLKPSKCEFGRREVEFLGYVISTGGLKPGPRKIKAIEEFPEPKNVHDIRRFLGLTNFFRRFVKDFARKAEPLSRLTKKGSQFEWKEEQRRSFGGLRKDLVEYPVLAHYNPELKTEVHCDASAEGLAGMVLQMDEDCKWRLVYCVSKKTTEAEKMYHSSKLELMAIVWTLDRLRQFLVGIKFTVVTDCQALVYMNAKKTTNPQIARWYNLIQEYDFEIRHKPGEKMAHVDGMSRAPVDDPRDTMEEIVEKNLEVCLTITLEEQILMIQHSDPELRDLIQIFRKDPCDRTVGEQNRINDYSYKGGRLFRMVKNGEEERALYVIPKSMRKSLVVKFHDLMGHFATDRTVNKIKELYWFPSMKRYVRRHVAMCLECLFNKVPGGKQQGFLHPIKSGKRPFSIVHMDHVGPFVRSTKGNQELLVIVDNLTRFVRLSPVRNTSTQNVLKVMKSFVNDFGLPDKIISDRGSCFTSRQFEEFCRGNGIHHTLNSTKHPQGNGMVERVNRTVLSTIATSIEDPRRKDWDLKIKEVERDLNNAVNKTTNKTPFETLHGYSPRFHDGILRRLADEDVDPWTEPDRIQESVRSQIENKQEIMKTYYDKKRCRTIQFEVGEIVVMRHVPKMTGEPTKAQPKYRGPLIITEVLPSDTYRVTQLSERTSGRFYTTTAHISQLKSWHSEEYDSATEESPDEEPEVEDTPRRNPRRSCNARFNRGRLKSRNGRIAGHFLRSTPSADDPFQDTSEEASDLDISGFSDSISDISGFSDSDSDISGLSDSFSGLYCLRNIVDYTYVNNPLCQ